MSVEKRGSKAYLHTGSHTYCYDELLPVLGEGAMGVVYRGVEMGTGKAVAIKRVKDQFANNPDIRRRAHLEASLMFSHPNLVEMLGCCEVAPNRGPIFIISGFVDGENIDRFIDRNIRNLPHSEQRICKMFLPVLDALSYIHQKNIVHMDIKPSNIMVENERNVRLMDLGIADISLMTNGIKSGLMGTPRYAAPEQFANADSKVKLSFATDIYEAGVTLYELITKYNPFPNSVEEARKLHQTTVLQKRPAISENVLGVIQKATSIVPSDRFQRAGEMKQALLNALQEPNPEPEKNWLYICIAIITVFIVLSVILIILM